MGKKTLISAPKDTVAKLKVLAKKKEGVRGKLAVKAETLRLKAKRLVVTAKEKESVRSKLATVARQLAATAKEKESVRLKLAATAKEKESIRSKLATVAKRLVVTAKEKESVRSKLATVARQLAATAKEKESIRSKLATVARQLAATAKEKEDVRIKLAITAKEKEDVRKKLELTAEKLAATAKEVESANKELKALDLAKDEFVSIASHQLRTPLTALKGYTGMLLDGDAGPINDKQGEYLKEIKNANDRMINLITALLNVSRVDLDVFVVEPEQVNLEKVAESVLGDLDTMIKDKKMRVETNFEKDLPLLSVDLNIIRMIFQNFLTNAVKYTSVEGTITLNVKKDGPNVLISVSDTGIGIPENAQAKIFTKMFRADNARVKDPEGTGLGLYIIKTTIEKTGGKLWFESKENKGSTFYVAIPLEGMKKKEGTKRFEVK